MLEVETLPETEGKGLEKRSPQAGSLYGGGQQYVLGSPGQPEPPPQIPGEYLSLLQQLQSQQGVSSQQVNPNDIQQLLISRTPYQFTSQPQQPVRPRLTPEQEQQRRLQESVAQKGIREQESRDAQRQQLRQYYKQAGLPAAAAYRLQQRPQILAAQQQTAQYYQPAQPQQQQPQPALYYQNEPDQVSYTQVQFGESGQQVGSKPPRVVYQSQPSQELVYRPAPVESSKPAVGAPQQYLIETTRPEDQQRPVAAPVVYYSPQVGQGYGQGFEYEAGPPAKSSIYVTRAGGGAGVGRLPTPGGGPRPLTQTELKALVDAGFQVGGAQQSAAAGYLSSPPPAFPQAYYGKRQSRRLQRPPPYAAGQQFANLYPVDAPDSASPTYVLALGKPQNS